jgi:hypothetical protein
MERAKKLITFFGSRAEVASIDDFGLLLSVAENTADAEDVLAAEDGDKSHDTDRTATPNRDD